jgi:predicted TIM-barrel fold metal-dependent hydrolase
MNDGLYDGPVIDAHTHLWDLAGDHHPWLMPDGHFGPDGLFDSMKKNYLLDDYRRDIAGQNVVASVHIEALWSIDEGQVNETRWLETLDKSDNLAIRYIAGAPFGEPTTEEILREQATFSRVVGVRQTIAWNPDPTKTMMHEPNISRKPKWRESLAVVQELGLIAELLIYPWQSDEVVDLAELHPDLMIVVDHIASPIDQTPEGLKAWAANVELLSTKPNIFIKISSAASYLPDPTLENVSFLVNRVINAFGPSRCMIGSDFPVGALSGQSYAEVYEQYRQSVKTFTRDEQYELFCGTAARVFRIPIEEILAGSTRG